MRDIFLELKHGTIYPALPYWFSAYCQKILINFTQLTIFYTVTFEIIENDSKFWHIYRTVDLVSNWHSFPIFCIYLSYFDNGFHVFDLLISRKQYLIFLITLWRSTLFFLISFIYGTYFRLYVGTPFFSCGKNRNQIIFFVLTKYFSLKAFNPGAT